MAVLPDPVTALVAALSKLPGIGPRSAERIALHLVQAEAGTVRLLADTLLQARERVRFCETCGSLTEISPCHFCTDPDVSRPPRGANSHAYCKAEAKRRRSSTP